MPSRHRARRLPVAIVLAAGLIASTASAQPYYYPQKGQSQQQQQQDRADCHVWAVQQTGFDPSTASASAPPPAPAPNDQIRQSQAQQAAYSEQVGAQQQNYQRALGSCMAGRGYTVQ
jgi:hypothetical protein